MKKMEELKELKERFKKLISKQDEQRLPVMGLFHEQMIPPAVTRAKDNMLQHDECDNVNSATLSSDLTPEDQAVLEAIDDVYFDTDPRFDPARLLLVSQPNEIDCSEIRDALNRLKQQYKVVSRTVSNKIMTQHTKCKEQSEQIVMLQKSLGEMCDVCHASRASLMESKKQFVSNLKLLGFYRKRRTLKAVMDRLVVIQTLMKTIERTNELLDDGDYPVIILMLNEGKMIAASNRALTICQILHKKLQDMREQTEEHLDEALAQIPYTFEAQKYARLQDAYARLHKSQLAIDQLHMHYVTAIHNSAFHVVHIYACTLELNAEALSKKQYRELCEFVERENFINCLTELCRRLWVFVCSYYKVLEWHQNQHFMQKPTNDDPNVRTDHKIHDIGKDVDIDPSQFDPEASTYIVEKLESGITKIWNDVQSKVAIFLNKAMPVNIQFDRFVQVLRIVNKLIDIGVCFSNGPSLELRESIRRQSVNYLNHYHNSHLDELRLFFEHELWQVCPVKMNFSILKLQEFKPIRNTLKKFPNAVKSSGSQSPKSMCSTKTADSETLFQTYLTMTHDASPFDMTDETTIEEDILSNIDVESDSSVSDEEEEYLKRTRVDRPVSIRTHILTNTTLTVLRQIGKYLHMSRILISISYEIFSCLVDLFEFYLYTVHYYFSADMGFLNDVFRTSYKLNTTLKRINDKLIYVDAADEIPTSPKGPVHVKNQTKRSQSTPSVTRTTQVKVQNPGLNECVDLDDADTLHGLKTRVIAVESLVFLAEQFHFLKGYLQTTVVADHLQMIDAFYDQSVNVVKDLRRPIFAVSIVKCFHITEILAAMAQVNWELREVASEHNSYVDMLLRDVQIFVMRLQKNVETIMTLSDEVKSVLWSDVAIVITRTLVKGFSNIKACSNGGRALMQLDFTQFVSNFEMLTGVRPMCHKEYTEAFIKAYYKTDKDLEFFIREHTEYTGEHLTGLIASIPRLTKPRRQELLALIADVEKTR